MPSFPPPSSPLPDTCPICGKPSGPGRLHPFCSRRCADIDLGRWFTGAYTVPTVEADDDSDPAANDPP